jgi:hypothetical protein
MLNHAEDFKWFPFLSMSIVGMAYSGNTELFNWLGKSELMSFINAQSLDDPVSDDDRRHERIAITRTFSCLGAAPTVLGHPWIS